MSKRRIRTRISNQRIMDWLILFSMSFISTGFAAQETNPKNFTLWTLEGKEQYIQAEMERYQEAFNQFQTQFPDSVVSVKDHLNHLIQWEIDKDKNTPDEIRSVYPNFVLFRLKLAALCRIAAKEQDVDALEILKHLFLQNTLLNHDSVLSTGGTIRRMQEEEQNRTLKDYPVYNLALECGVESVPVLKKILLTPNPVEEQTGIPHPVMEMNRFAAFALLYHIDKKEAEAIYDEYKKTMVDNWEEYVQGFMEHPVLNPWEFPIRYVPNERVEKSLERQRKRYPDRYPIREDEIR